MTDTSPTAPLPSLSDGFDPPALEVWRTLAERALKGAPFERLAETTFDGISIAPLYTAADLQGAGATPAVPDRDPYQPWDIRQPFAGSDAAKLNAQLLADLAGGASSVELLVGQGARSGLTPDALGRALEGVLLDLAPVAINASADTAIDAARTLIAIYADRQADPAHARPILNLGFATQWLARGGLPARFETLMADAAGLGFEVARDWPRAKVFCANGRGAHEAGASPAMELGVMLSDGVAQLRALDSAGLPPDRAAGVMTLRLAVGPDVIPEIAKLRAARLLWSRVLIASGAGHAAASLQAVTSARMLARNDAWTNILRTTCACFAAATGGADVITTLPFTAALGGSSELARRIARNTQSILMKESHLGHLVDPGAGAFAIEALTRDLAEAGWAAFQRIEAAGGIAAALREGSVQADIARSAAAQAKDVARRKRPITGVSNHPLQGEVLPAFEPEPPACPAPMPEDPIVSLPWTRLSEPFERLRAAGEAMGSPGVFFANLGPLSEFSARAGFARNLLSVGGLSTPNSEEPVGLDAVASAFAASGLKAAVICGSDSRYAQEAEAAARALKTAGCGFVMLAGKPADEAALRAAGADAFIFAGQDALEALSAVHAAMGIVA